MLKNVKYLVLVLSIVVVNNSSWAIKYDTASLLDFINKNGVKTAPKQADLTWGDPTCRDFRYTIFDASKRPAEGDDRGDEWADACQAYCFEKGYRKKSNATAFGSSGLCCCE